MLDWISLWIYQCEHSYKQNFWINGHGHWNIWYFLLEKIYSKHPNCLLKNESPCNVFWTDVWMTHSRLTWPSADRWSVFINWRTGLMGWCLKRSVPRVAPFLCSPPYSMRITASPPRGVDQLHLSHSSPETPTFLSASISHLLLFWNDTEANSRSTHSFSMFFHSVWRLWDSPVPLRW